MRSPVIIAGTPSTITDYAGPEYIRAMAEVAAGKYNIPIAIHLDHFEDVVENPKADDPRKYMTPGKEAMKKIVKHKMEVCGSANRY